MCLTMQPAELLALLGEPLPMCVEEAAFSKAPMHLFIPVCFSSNRTGNGEKIEAEIIFASVGGSLMAFLGADGEVVDIPVRISFLNPTTMKFDAVKTMQSPTAVHSSDAAKQRLKTALPAATRYKYVCGDFSVISTAILREKYTKDGKWIVGVS